MLGAYRLALALLVALSHVGVTVLGLNPGVVAVVGFYLVSGYVMTGLIRRHFDAPERVGGFYLDRFLRLFPHYLAAAALTLAWYLWHRQATDYLAIEPTLGNLVENALVVPLNFYMFNHADRFTLVPPAWSLGAEIQFYLVIPLLLISATRGIAATLSLCVFAAAAWGYLNTDWFGYRLLPGILFIFLIGSWLFDADRAGETRRRMTIVAAVVATCIVVALALAFARRLAAPYNREILLGLSLGVAALATLGHRARHAIDDAVGNLSYGVFLNHYPIIWIAFDGRVAGWGQRATFLALCVAVAALMYRLVERPVLDYRSRLRARRRTALEIAR